MKPRLRDLAACSLLLATLGANAPASPTAGDDRFGWFVLPYEGRAGVLQVVPADAPPGTVRRAVPLPETPALMSARAGALVMLFPPLSTAAERPIRQARRIAVSSSSTPEWTAFTPLTALPPLVDSAEPVSLALTDAGPVALRRAQGDASPLELWRLGRAEWSPEPIPPGAEAARRAWVCAIDGRAAIIGDTEAGAHLWTRAPGADDPWTEAPLTLPPHAARVIVVADQLLAIAQEPDGAESLHLLRADRAIEIARLERPDAPRWIVPVGSTVSIFSARDDADPGAGVRLDARVLSLSGTVLYDGPARAALPVDRREVEALLVLFASVLATIGVFVLRPAGSYRIAVAPPPGFALAEPLRRALAGAIDLGASLLIACLVWRVSLAEALSFTDLRHTQHGVWPLVSALAITVVHASLSESFTGRTLGKAVLGCRTVNASGANPALGQAFARNAVKLFCPPLALVSLLTPGAAHPGAFSTLVVIPVRELPPAPGDRG